MQTIVDELNKITNEQAETISEAIEDLGEDLEAAVELPPVSGTDNGKFLGVSGGEWTTVDPELPSVSSTDNGDFLVVHNGKWAKREVAPAVPDYPDEDGTYMLGVTVSSGTPTLEWIDQAILVNS